MMTHFKTLPRGAKGQVFSIDAMLSLLPMMMIVGAALQYSYLAGEQSQTIAQDANLESKMQLLSGSVMAEYVKTGGAMTCDVLGQYLGDALDLLGDGYNYDVRTGPECILSNLNGVESATATRWRLDDLQNPAASGSRMMLYGEGLEATLAEVHFTVWKK